jgi:hypothetical protein
MTIKQEKFSGGFAVVTGAGMEIRGDDQDQSI